MALQYTTYIDHCRAPSPPRVVSARERVRGCAASKDVLAYTPISFASHLHEVLQKLTTGATAFIIDEDVFDGHFECTTRDELIIFVR